MAARLTIHEFVFEFLANQTQLENGCIVVNCRKPAMTYTRIKWASHRFSAHRMSLELHTGIKIPKGKMACHKCDNPPCVNPNHLFIGSAKDNAEDCVAKGRYRNGQMLHPEIVRRGEDHSMAKLNWEKVFKIRSMPKERIATLSAMFGVSKSTIKDVRAMRYWLPATTLER